MKIVHSFKSKTFGKRKMICSKLRLGRRSCKRQRLPSCLLWQRDDYQPKERERDNLLQAGCMNDTRGGKLEVDARQQFMFGRRDCPPTGNNLCQAKIYIRQNLMWEKTRFLAKYHFRQKIIFDRNSCWQQFMLGNNSYFATISLGWGRLSAHRQNLWTFIYCACRQPNNSTATISALNFSKNAIFSVIYKEKDLMWQFELHLTPNDRLLRTSSQSSVDGIAKQ